MKATTMGSTKVYASRLRLRGKCHRQLGQQAGQPVADDNVPEQHETVCALAQNELDGLVSWHGMVNGPCTYRVAGVKLL
eukprot:COSAG02_NODE_1828_length_10742_cov_3.513013_10_plen_79_part_00